VKEKFTTNPQEVSDLSARLAFESHHAPQHGRKIGNLNREDGFKSHKAIFVTPRRPIRSCSTHAGIGASAFPDKAEAA
jgi:hypothetical protein